MVIEYHRSYMLGLEKNGSNLLYDLYANHVSDMYCSCGEIENEKHLFPDCSKYLMLRSNPVHPLSLLLLKQCYLATQC